MAAKKTNYIQQIIEDLRKTTYVKPDEIPTIELYMDQVTTFMDTHMASSKRSDDDKILTKTMINNYAKNDLLPQPIKKKYGKNHLLMMIFIYYFKGFLSISDIQELLNPLTDYHFDDDSSVSLEDIYREIISLEKKQMDWL